MLATNVPKGFKMFSKTWRTLHWTQMADVSDGRWPFGASLNGEQILKFEFDDHLMFVYRMGRLCGGAHEISGIKALIFLCGWVGGGGVGWVGVCRLSCSGWVGGGRVRWGCWEGGGGLVEGVGGGELGGLDGWGWW